MLLVPSVRSDFHFVKMPRMGRKSTVPVPPPVPKKQGLVTLPPETLLLILLNLPDLPSLLSLALSSRALYKVFRASESRLIDTILRRQIAPSVLSTALAANAALRIKILNVETSREFFQNFLQISPQTSPPLPPSFLRDAIQVSKLHFYVRSLARGFASRALAKAPGSQNGMEERNSVSETEVERFERALYRFEIYNFLHRKKQGDERHLVEDQIDTFFCAFSGSENEQLAVVHEFLAGLVIPAFNDLAEHDILWGSHDIEPATDSSCEFIQAYLARGLPALHRLTRAKSYHQRKKALYTPYPHYFTKFLYRGLEAYMLSTSAQESTHGHVSRLHNDGDSGPERAWSWTRKFLRGARGENAHFKDLSSVRSWAYVFWDQDRLGRWGTLDTRFIPHSDTDAERWEAKCREEQIQDSITRRSAIHVAGGSGWWSAECENKIIWRVGKSSPYDRAPERSGCDICCREVKCAPHRLILNLSKLNGARTDDGCFLGFEAKSPVDSIQTSPLSEDHEFRLSCLPSPPTDFRLSRLTSQKSDSNYFLTPPSPNDESRSGAGSRLSQRNSFIGRQTTWTQND